MRCNWNIYYNSYFFIILEHLNEQETSCIPDVPETEGSYLPPKTETQVQRIIGGEVTSISNAAYMAALLENNKFYCGGSIVSHLHVVSAASCVTL